MTALEEVIRTATPLVLPTKREAEGISKLARALLRKTAKAAERFPETRGAILGGSYAKGTWLPKLVDIDIFVKIDPSTQESRFEEVGLAVGAAATAGHPRGKKYAQHPYTEAEVNGTRVNIVPCFAVPKGKWKSAADRSPYHVNLVKRLPESKKTEVKLLKRFMKAVGVYGAEIEIQGFSGYMAEVLVISRGSLEGVLRYFAEFSPSNEERYFSVPDPVDERRDLAIAVSREKLGRFVLACREFLRSPNEGYFQRMRGKSRPSMKDNVVAVVFSHRRLSEDTLWGELRRTTKHVVRHLEVSGFKIARALAASNNENSSAVLLIPEYTALPHLEQRVGPTIDRRKDVAAFIKSNGGRSRLIWVDDEARVRVLRKRPYVELDAYLGQVVRGKAGPVGASAEMAGGMKRSAVVLTGNSLARAAKKSRWLSDGVTEIVTDALGTSHT